MYCFFFTDTATTEIYTLSLHDALPIWGRAEAPPGAGLPDAHSRAGPDRPLRARARRDRKSTRLNSSHQIISYAVFCLKKKIHDAYIYTLLARDILRGMDDPSAHTVYNI